MKAILYARFSPRPNADLCDSVTNQLADLREFCARMGWEVVAEFGDEAMSGFGELDRPGLVGALAALKRGYVLVVRNLNRLSREVYLGLHIEKVVAKKGAMLASMEDGGLLKNDRHARLVRVIKYAMADFQRVEGNERTKRKMRAHQENGRAMSKLPPYGWRREGKELIEDLSEQEVIQEVLELAGRGCGLREIAKRLNDMGTACRGSKWHHSTVGRIVRRAMG